MKRNNSYVSMLKTIHEGSRYKNHFGVCKNTSQTNDGPRRFKCRYFYYLLNFYILHKDSTKVQTSTPTRVHVRSFVRVYTCLRIRVYAREQ